MMLSFLFRDAFTLKSEISANPVDIKQINPNEHEKVDVKVSDSKFHVADTSTGGTITLTYDKPHGFFFAPGAFESITIKLIDPRNNQKAVYTKTYKYDASNPFRVFDAGKYHMNVTAKLSAFVSVYAHCINSTRRVFGYTNKFDLEVKESDIVYSVLWPESTFMTYRYNLSNVNAKAVNVVIHKVASEQHIPRRYNNSSGYEYISDVYTYNNTAAQTKTTELLSKVGTVNITNNGQKNEKVFDYVLTEKPIEMYLAYEKPREIEVEDNESGSEQSSEEGSETVSQIFEESERESGSEGKYNESELTESDGNGRNGRRNEDNNADSGSAKSSLATGAITGIVIACVAVVAIASVAAILIKKRFNAQKEESNSP